MKKQSVPVTRRALIQRVNRVLAKDGQAVKATRGRAAESLGCYFRLDIKHKTVLARNVNLEQLGRELGALRGWESLAR